jgi:HEAT repeat protein
MLGRMACAAYWFHPLIWIALRRLRAESERACDDLVLASGTRPSDYAGHLLEILTSARRGGAPSAAVAMARRTEFEGRMLAILDPAAPRGVLGRFRSVTLMGGLAVLFLCVAALAPTQPVPASIARASQANAPGLQPSSPANEQAAPRTEPRRRPAERAAEAEGDRDEADEEEESRPTDEQTALLVRVLRTDTDADVRRSAAWALASGGDGKAVEALVAALKTDADDGVREMAAWALAEARGESASAALASALQGDRSEKVRAIAAWALGQQRQSDTTALVAAAADRAMKVREAAIWGLGNQHLAAAPTPLIAGLRDAEAPVRVVSAWALSQIADPATAPALRAAFKDEKDDKVREAIFRALMLVGDRSPEVIEQVLQSTDADLRAHAVQMMSRHRGPWPWPWPRPQPRPYP